MIAWFRRKRPAPAPLPVRIAPEDRMIARWWGYTPQQWADLPPEVRAEKRHTVIWAPAAHTDPNRSPQTNIDPLKGQP